jgi:hypothetical protein
MLGIPIGFITVNVVEWLFHKYVLHGLGKNKNSIWSEHWHRHHKIARKNNMIDADYLKPFSVLLKSYELKAILLGSATIAPLLLKFPFFVTTAWIYGATYYIVHRQAHLDENWAKKYVPWHSDHHLLGNQSHNWNVTLPITDYIMGTRIIGKQK